MAHEDSNFKVYVRCRRPVLASASDPPSPYEAVSSEEIVRKLSPAKRYQFDHVFHENSDQTAIFEKCAEPLIGEFLRGYNGTLFAYGQTGTGKTYTVTGDCVSAGISDQAGIIPRVLESVLQRLEGNKSQDWILELTYIELYNEELRDLLSTQPPSSHTKSRGGSSTPPKQLRIIENQKSHSVEVVGATSIPVTTLESALGVVRNATARRKTAATQLNADSSRSHAVLTLTLVSREPVSGMAVRSKLHLVDLAGSENVARSGAVRRRAQEAGEINKSLLSLGRVIEMLVSSEQQASLSASSAATLNGSQQHQRASRTNSGGMSTKSKPYVSYRESKLTHLLQDSLGGSTKTAMVATISLAPSNAEESKNTLEYASRARSIRNQTQTEVEVMEMQGTLRGLSTRLEDVQHELMMQRSRDGGVFVSGHNYHQLKAQQRKYAELLAQKETAFKHHELEMQELRQANAALEAERDKIQEEVAQWKERNVQYESFVEANSQCRDSTDIIKKLLSQYSAKVDAVTNVLHTTVEELPQKLNELKSRLRTTAKTSLGTAELRSKFSSGLSSIPLSMNGSLKQSLEPVLVELDNSMQLTLSSVTRDVNEAINELHQNMDHIQQVSSQLRRQFESMQADIAIQQQSNREVLRLAKALQDQDQEANRVMAQLADERRHLVSSILENQEQTSHAKLSNSASSALDMVKLIKTAASRRAEPISLDKASKDQMSQHALERAIKQIEDAIDQNSKYLSQQLENTVTEVVPTNQDAECIPESTEINAIADDLDSCLSSFTKLCEEPYNSTIQSLAEKKQALSSILRKLQEVTKRSEEEAHRANQAITTMPRSPARTQNQLRSPTRSPLRNRNALRSLPGTDIPGTPTRKPAASLFRNPPRSPLRALGPSMGNLPQPHASSSDPSRPLKTSSLIPHNKLPNSSRSSRLLAPPADSAVRRDGSSPAPMGAAAVPRGVIPAAKRLRPDNDFA